jgi:hypothetical protein
VVNQLSSFVLLDIAKMAVNPSALPRRPPNGTVAHPCDRTLSVRLEAAAELRDAVSRQETVGDRFLDVCRASLQGE